jgi:hypothetical protein
LIVLSATLAIAAAQGFGGSSYNPAPSSYEKKEPPMPYQYAYDVKDQYAGVDFDKNEEQDSYGNLKGQYTVQLPDGRRQIVSYTANHEDGFNADVQYEGQAQYPPAPQGGYGKAPSRYN